jgi:ATPase subunit of ABC transporter with duplicated ATPase domains
MTTVIALIGLNGAGKSTMARQIKDYMEYLGKTAEVVALATPLKIIAANNCGYLETHKRDGHRDILIKLAADIRKHLGNEVFVYACLDKIVKLSKDYIIIEDLRWSVEADLINTMHQIHFIKAEAPGKIAESSDFDRLWNLETFLDENGFEVYCIPYCDLEARDSLMKDVMNFIIDG